MPNPLPRLGGPSLNNASNAAASNGVTLTPSGSANTKGSWTELIASTSGDTACITIQAFSVNTASEFLFDIGLDVGGTVEIIVPDLFCSTETATSFHLFSYTIFTNIPAGSRVMARCQSDQTASTMRIALQTHAPGAAGIGGLGRHEACGVNTANTGLTTLAVGATPHTDTAFSAGQLIASTSFDYRHLNVCIAHIKNSAASTATWLVDIGVGASGSESVIWSDILAVSGTGSDMACTTVNAAKDIPAGSRIAARARCAIGTATDREIMVALWGSG